MQITVKPEGRALPGGGGESLLPDLTRGIDVHVVGDDLEPVVVILLESSQRDTARRVGRCVRGRQVTQRTEELGQDFR